MIPHVVDCVNALRESMHMNYSLSRGVYGLSASNLKRLSCVNKLGGNFEKIFYNGKTVGGGGGGRG